MISEGFALLFCPHPQEIAIQEKNKMPMSVACSQTLYFLFKVRQAWVIKYEPRPNSPCGTIGSVMTISLSIKGYLRLIKED